jgi:hypothetical protein
MLAVLDSVPAFVICYGRDMERDTQWTQLEYAINLLIDNRLPGKWTIQRRIGGEPCAYVRPTGLLKKPRLRQAAEWLNDNGFPAMMIGSKTLAVGYGDLADTFAADPGRPAERPDWPKRRLPMTAQ